MTCSKRMLANWICVLLAMLCLLRTHDLFAQHQVLFIQGSVKHLNQKPVKVGEWLQPRQPLIFVDSAASLSTYSPAFGRKYWVKPGALPHYKQSNEAPFRAAPDLSPLIDTLRAIIKGGNMLFFSPKGEIDLFLENPLLRQPMETAQFFVGYTYQGDTLLHRIPFNEDEAREKWDYLLPVSPDIIYRDVKGKPIPQHLILDVPKLYVSVYGNDPVGIDVFNPVFIDDESQLRYAVARLMRMPPGQRPFKESLPVFLEQQYAPPNMPSLKRWLKTYFNYEWD
jgi:hypothetical protein